MKMVRFASLLILTGLVFLVGCGRLPDEKLLKLGKEMEDAEKFEEAIAYYDKLVKQYPQSPLAPEALYSKAKVYASGLNQFDEAVATFEEVVRRYPTSSYAAASQFMIGFVYANNVEDTAKARVAYLKFKDMYPDHELISSVDFELKYLGKDINEIPELQNIGK